MQITGMSIQNVKALFLIDHFTVVSSVTWPLNGSEAGGDLALRQTSVHFSCKCT